MTQEVFDSVLEKWANKELFEKHKDPLSLFPFRIGSHYNKKGYQLVAKTIFNKIKILDGVLN